MDWSLHKAVREYNLVAQSGWDVPTLKTPVLDDCQKAAVRKVWTVVTGIFTGAHEEDATSGLREEIPLLLGEASSPSNLMIACDALAVGIEAGIVPTESMALAHDLVESFGASRVSARLSLALGVKSEILNDDGNETRVGEMTSESDASEEGDALQQSANVPMHWDEVDETNPEVEVVPEENYVGKQPSAPNQCESGDALPAAKENTELKGMQECESGDALPAAEENTELKGMQECEITSTPDNSEEQRGAVPLAETSKPCEKTTSMKLDRGVIEGQSERSTVRPARSAGVKDAQPGLQRCLLFAPAEKPTGKSEESITNKQIDNLDDTDAWPAIITEKERQIRAEKKVLDDAAHAARLERMRVEKQKKKEEAERKAREKAERLALEQAEKRRADAERRGLEQARKRLQARGVAPPPAVAADWQRSSTRAQQPATSTRLIWGVNNFCGNRNCTLCYPNGN